MDNSRNMSRLDNSKIESSMSRLVNEANVTQITTSVIDQGIT